MKLQEILKKDFDDDLVSMTFCDEMRGTAPGGTFATVLHAINGDESSQIRAPRSDFDPFLRLPDGSKSQHVSQADLPKFPEKSETPKGWTVPFVMALVNSQVVRWSYALRSQGSPTVTFKEYALHPDFKTAFVNYAGLAMFGSMLFNPLTSYVVERYLIPKPGEGPSMEAMEKKREF
jgi:short subunit dehydrogenase-like uncharacterized protein